VADNASCNFRAQCLDSSPMVGRPSGALPPFLKSSEYVQELYFNATSAFGRELVQRSRRRQTDSFCTRFFWRFGLGFGDWLPNFSGRCCLIEDRYSAYTRCSGGDDAPPPLAQRSVAPSPDLSRSEAQTFRLAEPQNASTTFQGYNPRLHS